MDTEYSQFSGQSGILINFYGDIKQLRISGERLPLYAEDICEECICHIFRETQSVKENSENSSSPTFTLPLFGLVDTEHKIWQSLREKISCAENVHEFWFRLRFVPLSNHLRLFSKVDSQTWEYFFLQLRDDFLNDRFHEIYRKEISKGQLLGYVVMGYFIPKRIDNKVGFCHVKTQLPKQMHAKYKGLWPRWRLYKSIREHVAMYRQETGSRSRKRQLQIYVETMLSIVSTYGSETYKVTEIENDGNKVEKDIVVDLFSAKPPGLYFATSFICQLSQIASLSLSCCSNGEFKGNLHIDFKNGRPRVLLFKDSRAAESFVSAVDGYFQLMYNYNITLCYIVSVEPPSHERLRELKAHGPMQKEEVEKRLQDKFEEEHVNNPELKAVYLIYQSLHSLSEYCVARFEGREGADGRFVFEAVTFSKETNMYTLRKEEKAMEFDCKELHRHLRASATLVKPEIWCALTDMFTDELSYYQYQVEQTKVTAKGPRLFMDEELILTEMVCVGKGRFTKVSSVELKLDEDGKMFAVKELSKTDGKLQEGFQKGLQRLMQLQTHRGFVAFYGQLMAPPYRVLLDFMERGSVERFMKVVMRQPEFNNDVHLNFQKVLFIASQLIDCLVFMSDKNVMHGNLRCRNILIKSLTAEGVQVVVADPGVADAYNSHRLEEEVNIERLPWIAVERFSELDHLTLNSEIYSFGTVLWEIFANGDHPSTAINLRPGESYVKFYKEGKKPGMPARLLVEGDDENSMAGIKGDTRSLIEDCWATQPDDRPDLQILRRQVFHLLTCLQENDEEAQSDDNWEEVMKMLDIRSQEVRPTEYSDFTNGDHIIHPVLLTILNEDLGSGCFGVVKKGTLAETGTIFNQQSRSRIEVAVKQVKKKDDNEQHIQFEEEIKLVCKLRHPNIVKILGTCHIDRNTQVLVMELMCRGCISKYLENCHGTSETVKRLFKFCRDVAEGMSYLHSNNIIHRDLAARNVLLNDDSTAKITDFGMARVLDQEKKYYKPTRNKEMPFLWCSPETMLTLKFTKKADVWSYAIFMWEVFTLGKKPRLEETTDAKKVIVSLSCNKRLGKPAHAWTELYDFMVKECWLWNHEDRPSFEVIIMRLSELAKTMPN